MDTKKEQELIETCRQYRAQKTTSLRGTEGPAEISRYTCAQRYQNEQKKIFQQLPLILLHSSELPEKNHFQPIQTPLGSLLVSRDENGQVHVFYNICRHRGAKLVKDKACSRRIVCPYHAWSYAPNGELLSVPAQGSCFPDLIKENNQLISIPSAEKYGFIWACPAAEASENIEAHLDLHLGDLISSMQWINPDQLKIFKRTTKIWNGNWKLFAEGGLETYHFSFAHKETIAPYFYNNTAVIDQIGQHFRVVMPTKALESEAAKTNPNLSLHDCSHTLFYLLPGSVFLVQKKHVEWIQIRPLKVDQTEISITSLIPKDVNLDDSSQKNHWQKNHDITNLTLDEDWVIGESIQESLSTGAMKFIQYGRNEWALQQFNQNLNALLNR